MMKKHDLSEDGTLSKEEFTAVVDDIVAGIAIYTAACCSTIMC